MAYRREAIVRRGASSAQHQEQQRQQRGAASDSKTSSLNRRLRNIWEREGREYGEDVIDEDTIVERFETTIKLQKACTNRVMRDIHRSKTVDYCFLIDATGSMQPHIDGVRDSVEKVVNSLVESQRSQSGIKKLRFAVVAYRDFTDNVPLELFEFNERPEMCINFCRHLVASGGGDAPEDVFSGLEATTRLSWAEDAMTRVVFHMADAPCHGRQYHASDLADSYPKGDPNGRKEAMLFATIKRLGIDYYFGKINSSTDRMIAMFEAAYGRDITSFDVQAASNITEAVISSITTSVDWNVEKTKLGTAHMESRDFKLDLEIPNWDTFPVQIGKYLQYSLPKSFKDIEDDVPLYEKEISNVRVKIANNPFAEGAERIAYYGLDLFEGYNVAGRGSGRGTNHRSQRGAMQGSALTNPTEVVLKEYKFVGHKQNSIDRYRTTCEVQTVAFFLADKFNKVTATIGVPMQIKFLKVRTIILSKNNTLRVMSCERRYIGNGAFLKFTNNCGYSMQHAAEVRKHGLDDSLIDLVMAFSHWTYYFSNGFLMVVDLQGQICPGDGAEKILMTDPAIHCKDGTRYAPLNLGIQGMQAFFDAHECNSLCKRLGLQAFNRLL